MANNNHQFANGESNGQGQLNDSQGRSGANTTDTLTSKRSAVRQKLAIALMAVGGSLVTAAIIWLVVKGKK